MLNAAAPSMKCTRQNSSKRRHLRRSLVDQQHIAAEHLAVDFFQILAQVTLTLTEGQPEQTHEDGQIIAATRFDR